MEEHEAAAIKRSSQTIGIYGRPKAVLAILPYVMIQAVLAVVLLQSVRRKIVD